MEIINHRRKMLDAMESNANGNVNFAMKVISMENVEDKNSTFKKNMEEVRRKNHICFFSIFQVITLGD